MAVSNGLSQTKQRTVPFDVSITPTPRSYTPLTTSISHMMLPSFNAPFTPPAPPQLTHASVWNMLQNARADLAVRYAHTPLILAELEMQYCSSLDDCYAAKMDPIHILSIRLRLERALFYQWNKNFLGDTEIHEDLESFPLRFAVVEAGFPELTEHLLPIYQRTQQATPPAEFPYSPPAPARQISKISTKSKTPRGCDGTGKVVYNKLQDAPPANLEFPNGNITLAEMAAFHPEGIKSWDMIDRFCANGGSSAVYATMVNHHREMSRGKIENNSVYRMMKGQMTKRAKIDHRFNQWSVSVHNQIEGLDEVDPSSVSVTGFRTPAEGRYASAAAPIPMSDFAKGVKLFPTGYDALDFTRAVQYCLSHPEEQWMYPTDYERLVNQLGPATVNMEHHDCAVLSRYTTTKFAADFNGFDDRNRDERGRLQKHGFGCWKKDFPYRDLDSDSDEELEFDTMDDQSKKRKRFFANFSFDDDDISTSTRKRPSKRAPSKRKSVPSHMRYAPKSEDLSDINSESDSELYQGPKHVKKSAELRRSGRATKIIRPYIDH